MYHRFKKKQGYSLVTSYSKSNSKSDIYLQAGLIQKFKPVGITYQIRAVVQRAYLV